MPYVPEQRDQPSRVGEITYDFGFSRLKIADGPAIEQTQLVVLAQQRAKRGPDDASGTGDQQGLHFWNSSICLLPR